MRNHTFQKERQRRGVRFLALSLIVSIALPSQRVVGQIPYNFVDALDPAASAAIHSSKAVIRTVSGTRAVAALESRVYLIDAGAGMVHHIDLGNTKVYDMRVIDDFVFFCGKYYEEGCIGFFKLSEFLSGGAENVVCHHLTTNYLTSFERLAAYRYGGFIRLVAVGECIFNNINPYTDFIGCADPSETCSCVTGVMAEAKFDGTDIQIEHHWYSTTTTYMDWMNDVVETENHLVLVGYSRTDYAISIHRCDRGNVFGTYSNNWCLYPMDGDNGSPKYKACLMRGDTIAVSSIGKYDSVGEHYVGTVYTFDMGSMDNTTAQRVGTEIKDDPGEMLYMADSSKLVLVRDVYYPAVNTQQSSFITLSPYATGAYYAAPTWFSVSPGGQEYESLDLLATGQYIATGGNFWCSKEAWTADPASTCYKTQSVTVKNIKKLSKILGGITVSPHSLSTPMTFTTPIVTSTFFPQCVY